MKTLLEAAQSLARSHLQEDPATERVMLAAGDGEVRLVEVTPAVGYTGEVLPFAFPPRPEAGVPYRALIVVVNPQEWREILAGKLRLPDGWGAAADLLPVL